MMPPADGFAERRGATRFRAIPGAAVIFDGRTHPLANWSASGFLCLDYHGHRGIGDRVWVQLIAAPMEELRHDFALEAEVVRIDPDRNRLAARYTRLRSKDVAEFKAFFARHGLEDGSLPE